MMKVKELIELLQELPQDLPIITSIDDEGNGFRHIQSNWVCVDGWNGDDDDIEIGLSELTPELESEGWSEEDVMPYKCVVIG